MSKRNGNSAASTTSRTLRDTMPTRAALQSHFRKSRPLKAPSTFQMTKLIFAIVAENSVRVAVRLGTYAHPNLSSSAVWTAIAIIGVASGWRQGGDRCAEYPAELVEINVEGRVCGGRVEVGAL
jgi:hypothetical protein